MNQEKQEFKDLSETEKEIMELFWAKDNPFMFADILSYFNETKGRNWKKQTLSVFLQRLTDKEMLSTEKVGRFLKYSASKNLEEYERAKAEGFLQKQYHGSMEQFFVALYGGKTITQEEKRQLKQWIDNLEEG